MPSHGETSPATAPTHCLSKKWLKYELSHSSLEISTWISHKAGAELWRVPNYRLRALREPQWLRATPGSVHMDFSWHCHLPQAPWDRIPVPLSSLGWAIAFMWQSLHGPTQNSSFIYTHSTPLPCKWKYSQTSELLKPWVPPSGPCAAVTKMGLKKTLTK